MIFINFNFKNVISKMSSSLGSYRLLAPCAILLTFNTVFSKNANDMARCLFIFKWEKLENIYNVMPILVLNYGICFFFFLRAKGNKLKCWLIFLDYVTAGILFNWYLFYFLTMIFLSLRKILFWKNKPSTTQVNL